VASSIAGGLTDRPGGQRAVPRSGEHGAVPRVAQLPVRDGAWSPRLQQRG
jgi:hypothetical protein